MVTLIAAMPSSASERPATPCSTTRTINHKEGDMKKQTKFPYGQCECSDCSISAGGCGGFGPAAFEVERAGVTMRVCTRCDLTSDKNKTLLVTPEDNAKLWIDFDPLGAVCIMGELGKKKED